MTAFILSEPIPTDLVLASPTTICPRYKYPDASNQNLNPSPIRADGQIFAGRLMVDYMCHESEGSHMLIFFDLSATSQVSLGNMLSSELQVWHHLSVNSVTCYQVYTF